MSKSASEILFEAADAYQAQGVYRGNMCDEATGRTCALGTISVVVCDTPYQGYGLHRGEQGDEAAVAVRALEAEAKATDYTVRHPREEEDLPVYDIISLNDEARYKSGRLLNVGSICAVIRRAARTLKAQGR